METRNIVEGKRVTEGFWNFHKAPRAVEWAGNDLLAVDYGIEAESVNLAGKKVAEIGERIIGKAGSLAADSPLLLVYTDVEKRQIALANARTGELRKFRYPMSGKPISWAFDKHGELRAISLVDSAFWQDNSTVTNWYRASARADWEKLAQFKPADEYWVPVSVPDAAHSLVVSSRIVRDTYAVFTYDTQQHALGEMMAGHPTLDILSVRDGEQDDGAFERVVTGGMQPQYIWFAPAWAKAQNTADAALPGRVNVLSGNPANKVLVYSYGDVDPGAWHVLDMVKRALTLVGRVKPSIDPAAMRPMQSISYRARDGLTIPAFLTVPENGKQPAPMVVMIHGGPIARDDWAWDADVQVLASRGYVVFQPQFRGSSGFGRTFEEAGYGQWGRSMQDDISAGVEHLIAQGIADPKRICIYGASYGGYAALWGLVKTPGLYRCGVSFAGVTDIEYMFHDASDQAANKLSRELMHWYIGAGKLSKEDFDQVSPLRHAAQIQAPVLLMHGDEDERVPIAHSKKMQRALEENHKQVSLLVFEREGHGLYYAHNEYRFFETLLAFLEKHIGAPAPAQQH